jgi:hypothetical protein
MNNPVLKQVLTYISCIFHGMARSGVADGGDGLQIWRSAANISNNQSRTADNGLSSSLGVWRGTKSCHRKKTN